MFREGAQDAGMEQRNNQMDGTERTGHVREACIQLAMVAIAGVLLFQGIAMSLRQMPGAGDPSRGGPVIAEAR